MWKRADNKELTEMSNRDLDSDNQKNMNDEGNNSAEDEDVEECVAMATENDERTTGLAKVTKEKICAIKEIVEQLRQLLSLLLTSIKLIAEVYAVVCEIKK